MNAEHDPFIEPDYEQEIAKYEARIVEGVRKITDKYINEMNIYVNNTDIRHICLDLHFDNGGKATCNMKMVSDRKAIADKIEKGEPQELF